MYGSRVEAYEDIRVPAGTFKAFRVSIDARYVTQWGENRLVLTTWYAPELRQFVKTESRVYGGLNEAGVQDRLRLQDFEVVALDRPTLAPLRVTLESPLDQVHVTGDTLAVTGKATSGRGVALVTVTLNAVEVARLEPPDGPQPIVRIDLSAPLRPGQNVLLVTGTDTNGEIAQEARTIFYEPAGQRASASSDPKSCGWPRRDPGGFRPCVSPRSRPWRCSSPRP